MKVALRAVHESLANVGDPWAVWLRLVSFMERNPGHGGRLDSQAVREMLAAEHVTGSAAMWLAHLHGLGLVDQGGLLDLKRAGAVGVALEVIGDSFSLPTHDSTWVPVVTIPDHMRIEMAELVIRQTAGVLLNLLDRAKKRVLMAAPFVDAPAVDFLRPSLIACGLRGVHVNIGTSSGNAHTFWPLAECWPAAGEATLTVTEILPEIASLGSHAKVLVVDGALAYVGSANLTAAGLGRQLELGVEVSGPRVKDLERTMQALIAMGNRVFRSCGATGNRSGVVDHVPDGALTRYDARLAGNDCDDAGSQAVGQSKSPPEDRPGRGQKQASEPSSQRR